ncbi:hypothetical protein [Tunturiibacter lichenicola]|uniref:hypothetical protein n=1 Tax=Tunturiibacter lichenicola TaxID=2051959 RepID=UPI0021B21D1E|nr:hypothetical protein [Edaphobacter lichenicola]
MTSRCFIDGALLDAFLDGFTGAGLWEKLSPPGRPDQFRAVMRAGIYGFVAAVVALLGFFCLVIHNHPITAGILIGSLYLGQVVRFIRRRRRRT